MKIKAFLFYSLFCSSFFSMKANITLPVIELNFEILDNNWPQNNTTKVVTLNINEAYTAKNIITTKAEAPIRIVATKTNWLENPSPIFTSRLWRRKRTLVC